MTATQFNVHYSNKCSEISFGNSYVDIKHSHTAPDKTDFNCACRGNYPGNLIKLVNSYVADIRRFTKDLEHCKSEEAKHEIIRHIDEDLMALAALIDSRKEHKVPMTVALISLCDISDKCKKVAKRLLACDPVQEAPKNTKMAEV